MPMLITLRMGLPVKPFPLARADAISKRGHAIEDFVDLGDDIFAIHKDGLILGSTQRDMEHGALLSDIDLFAAEHGIDVFAELRFFGEGEEKAESLAGDAVLGVIEEEARGFSGHAFAALRIVSKKGTQVRTGKLAGVGLELFPRGQAGEGASL